MTQRRRSTILTITAAVSAVALFTAMNKTINAGQGGYEPHRYYHGYDRGYMPPAPPGYMYYRPGMPRGMQGYGHPYPPRNSVQQPSEIDQPPAETGSSATSAALNVSINGMRFQPAVIRVKAGDQVTWTNNAPMLHTVTGSNDGSLASQRLDRGALFSHTFKEPGTYAYYCALHPSMSGTVIVEQ